MAVTENPPSTGLEARDGVLNLLEQAARTIDQMWRAAQSDAKNPTAVALGEASLGVHRAIIALQSGGAFL